jgi:glucuronate isomerase
MATMPSFGPAGPASQAGLLHPDRLFPADPETRAIARRLHSSVADLPILSPHGHTEAQWLAENKPFPNPTALFLEPDHYLFRMLYSQGVPMDAMGIPTRPALAAATPKPDPRAAWRLFAENYHLFRGTPSRLWLDYAFAELFGIPERLSPANADRYFDHISEQLATPEFLPRALYRRFRLEVLATTDAAIAPLTHHEALAKDPSWHGRVIPTFRPDAVIDPDNEHFAHNIHLLGDLTKEDTHTWKGYLNALRKRRQFFKERGATATDHGHPTANTCDLSKEEAGRLFTNVLGIHPRHQVSNSKEAETFRAQMLTEMARMSLDDGLVMQLHAGAYRNHNHPIFAKYGPDKGADVPQATEYVHGLRRLLSRFGNEPGFSLIVFTLDESTYARELAPLAGHYPALKLGPPWWFHDSPEGLRRYRESVTESAGFYNTAGFNDDTRAFFSIPGRHDTARRMDAGFLAKLVAEHRLDEDEAFDLMQELTYRLAKKAYRL